MLNYPANFDTTAFPAGKRISVARMAAICCMAGFFLIVCMCGVIWWLSSKQQVTPMLIYVNANTGQWETLGAETKSQESEYYYVLQKSLVGIFTQKWFTISGNPEKNEKMWQRCNRDAVCTKRIEQTIVTNSGCDIFCMSDEQTYKDFAENVLPLYKNYISLGDQWSVDVNTISISPAGTINVTGGLWAVKAHVRAVPGPGFNIIAYVNVEQNVSEYPQSMGYHITGFKAYNVQQ